MAAGCRRFADPPGGRHRAAPSSAVVLEGSGTFVADDAGSLQLPDANVLADVLRTDFLPYRSPVFAVVDTRGRVAWTHKGDEETSLLVIASQAPLAVPRPSAASESLIPRRRPSGGPDVRTGKAPDAARRHVPGIAGRRRPQRRTRCTRSARSRRCAQRGPRNSRPCTWPRPRRTDRSGLAVSIHCWPRPRSRCLARTGTWTGWSCARRCLAAATRACIPTTSRATGRAGGGGACRPCGASAHSPPITGRCGSSPVRAESTRTRPTRCPSAARWAGHPAEVKIVAPAGSLILFNNADLWHSGTFNYSPAPRLAVTALFSAAAHRRIRCPRGRQPAGVQQQRNPPPGRWRPTKRLDRVRGLSGRHQVGARGPGGGCGGVQTRLAIPNTRDVSGAPRSRPEGYSVDRVIIDPEVGEFEAVGLQRRKECCQGEIVIVADQDRIGGWLGCPFLARSVRQP